MLPCLFCYIESWLVHVLQFVWSMAEQWSWMVVFRTLFIMAAVTTVTDARPVFTSDRADAAKIAAICSSSGLVCAGSTVLLTASSKAAGVQRDHSISTINDIQKVFFLESALVVGATMTLNANLSDDFRERAFLPASSNAKLPSLTSSNAAAVVRHFGVTPNSDLATATETDAMAKFVSSELGSKVKVLSTSHTPAPAPVTITGFRKGSVAEGQKIVVCHVENFPSSLYYCHRVTGTKVITATLRPSASSADIQAVGVCHIDTSLWLSTHPAFSALNIPRGDEACHWLVDSDLVFVPTTDDADAQMG